MLVYENYQGTGTGKSTRFLPNAIIDLVSKEGCNTNVLLLTVSHGNDPWGYIVDEYRKYLKFDVSRSERKRRLKVLDTLNVEVQKYDPQLSNSITNESLALNEKLVGKDILVIDEVDFFSDDEHIIFPEIRKANVRGIVLVGQMGRAIRDNVVERVN